MLVFNRCWGTFSAFLPTYNNAAKFHEKFRYSLLKSQLFALFIAIAQDKKKNKKRKIISHTRRRKKKSIDFTSRSLHPAEKKCHFLIRKLSNFFERFTTNKITFTTTNFYCKTIIFLSCVSFFSTCRVTMGSLTLSK